MAAYSIIFEALDNLRSFAEGGSDPGLLKEVEDAERTALSEILKIELSSSDANYDAVMAVVYPELQRTIAND
jgi:hypothetical protein